MPSESTRLADQQLPLPAAAVRTQLEKILRSDTFIRSERLSAFLRYVVDATIRGGADGLKETVIGRDLYGGGTDFDTATDPIVRVDARRLRDKLREYYSEFPGDSILITLPKGSYVPLFARNPSSPPLVVRALPRVGEGPAWTFGHAARSIPLKWWLVAIVCAAGITAGVLRMRPRPSVPQALPRRP